MTEGALATKYKNIYFNTDKLIKDVKESWKIEVWDIKGQLPHPIEGGACKSSS